MYGLYSLVRQLREQLNDKTDRNWSFDKKVRAIEAGVAALAEHGILEARTHLGISTMDSTFQYALPNDVEPGRIFSVFMPTDSTSDPMHPILQWGVEARGSTNMLALYQAYPDSRNLHIEYLAPFQVYPMIATMSTSVSATDTSLFGAWSAEWPASGFLQIWPKTETGIGETIYYGQRSATVIWNLNRGVEGRASAFAAGDTIGPALDFGAEIREVVLLCAQAECWSMRQAMSPRSQYLQNYANLEIKLRRQFNDRIPRLRTRMPVLRQAPRWPRYGPSTSPTTVKDYFTGR